MSAPPADRQRQVVPRWRSFTEAILAGELAPASSRDAGTDPDLPAAVASAQKSWAAAVDAKQTDLATLLAADVIGASLAGGRPDLAADAIDSVLANADAPPAIRALASRASRKSDDQVQLELPVTTDEGDAARVLVRSLRRRLAVNPKNAVGWVDLARAFATLGSPRKALRAMDVAVQLGPENRFVLRSASRLYVHVADPERAHRLLSEGARSAHDPWLLASQLAVGHLSDRPLGSMRPARRLAEDTTFSAFERSELFAALATLELSAGNDKRSKKLFGHSLEDPHENSLAQAEWASGRTTLQVPQVLLETPDSYEARARDAEARGAWRDAYRQTTYWLHAEPFSAAPAVHGSYVASIGMRDYGAAIDIARAGIMANPHDVTLRNNLAFSLAASGDVDAAAAELDAVRHLVRDPRDRVLLAATGGMVAYRSGDVASGRTLYRKALDMARATRETARLVPLAAIHFATEEVRAGGTESETLLAEARDQAKGVAAADASELVRQMEELAAEHLRHAD